MRLCTVFRTGGAGQPPAWMFDSIAARPRLQAVNGPVKCVGPHRLEGCVRVAEVERAGHDPESAGSRVKRSTATSNPRRLIRRACVRNETWLKNGSVSLMLSSPGAATA